MMRRVLLHGKPLVPDHHPQPVTLDDPRMKFALMTTMIAFLAFAALIVWSRYYVERIAQKIAVMHVQKVGARASVVLPTVLFFQLPSEIGLHRQRTFMYSGYICCLGHLYRISAASDG
jgi:hypothetical protein